ncbi:MAG: OmpA family protein [Deltaproteobacteria bacterium]|nr:MAG: OmpA family protein [Deltaproteobacteria bacterium]
MRRLYLLGIIGWATTAVAVDIDPFSPSGSMPHKAGTPSTESPALTNEGLSLGATATIARNMATYRFADGRTRSLAPEAFNTAFYGGWTFEDRLRVELIAPIYFFARTGTTSEAFQGPALGDTLVQANVRLFENDQGSFGVSVVPTLGLPTGPRSAYLGRGGHGRLRGAVGGELAERFGYAANLGFTLSRGDVYENVALGSSLDGALGAWVHLDPNLRIGADIEHRFGISNAPGRRNTIGWGSAFAQVVRDDGLGLSVSAGRGTFQGVGSPQWRVQAGLTYAPRVKDSDGDGIPDKHDLCPHDPEDFDGFQDYDGCPELDNDGDTFLDVDDLCPNDPEDFDGFEDTDGCPDPDNDQDGILDIYDACPDTPGVDEQMGCPDADGDGLTDALDQCPLDPGPPETQGCPDRDGDGVPDWRDACPDEPRSEGDPVETSSGCPTRAFVQGDQIKITEKVMFQTGRATVDRSSFPLLDDVVAALQRYPQIRQVEIAGHTDNVGNPSFNRNLSNQRAAAVKRYLLDRGIDRDRLSSEGYGMDQPIDTNLTERGRERNRRVEFRILQQDPVTEEVDLSLGADIAALSVLLPTDRPFTKVEIDGELASPRAPFRGKIVEPGAREVRIFDELRGLDYTVSIEVKAGETAIVRVPESEIARPEYLPPAGPVPDGSPLAFPKGGREALPRPEGVERREPGPAKTAPDKRMDPQTAPGSPPPLAPDEPRRRPDDDSPPPDEEGEPSQEPPAPPADDPPPPANEEPDSPWGGVE